MSQDSSARYYQNDKKERLQKRCYEKYRTLFEEQKEVTIWA